MNAIVHFVNNLSNLLKPRLRRAYYLVVDFFPTSLPVGLTAFEKWTDRLLFTYFPPTMVPPDEASFRFSVAAMILHLDAGKSRVPNRYFGKHIRKGASNEVASYVMRDLKAKRDALIEAQEKAMKEAAEKELNNQEATSPQVASDGQKQ